MKCGKKFGLLILTIAMNSIMWGQESEKRPEISAEDRANKRTEKMKQELGLTEDQSSKVYTINLTHIIEMDKLREEQKVLREKMKAEKESTRSEIKEVLTPEQNVLFDQKEAERKKKMEEKKSEHRHD